MIYIVSSEALDLVNIQLQYFIRQLYISQTRNRKKIIELYN
jgi:hypothetical protein